ncbi:hypothetical protein LVJ82_17695 [Vitreoscilla massiliensis]|uniref:Uncharacterized protein n=1 Tax=Vitreoscilla massiliensis TaxID=1689272 RepID=A0ABY4E0K0_9NEIS|nr:hypothetical protein [Vitreoscilla massiliensis]UOO89251.1 hypothetical protein LVJ82_17695 [Vitreoscilla massiliensis]
MKQREFPCITLCSVQDSYFLFFHREFGFFFEIEESTDYKQIALRGLQCSHAIRVPFYNEVKS